MNEATAYSELGDFPLGLDRAQKAAGLFGKTTHQDYIAKALLVYGNLEAASGNIDEALPYYSKVITLSQRAHLSEIEASAWEDQGEALLDANRLTTAEGCLQKAYALRARRKSLSSLAVTACNLAELKLKQGQLQASLHFLDQVDSLPSAVLSEIPPYEILRTRGELYAALGRPQAALPQLYKAVLSADRMRASTLPATSVKTIVHLHDVYQDYVSLAARLALEHRDNSLARRSLGVLARSRAAAYRDEIERNLNREGRLPAQYLELLGQLQQLQARDSLRDGSAHSMRVSADRLRLRLAELENQLSLRSSSRKLLTKEQSPDRIVSEIQAHLRPDELLLSISLGSSDSFLWAVTSKEVHLYHLPNRKRIEQSAEAFAQSVRMNNGAIPTGCTFSAELIGQVSPTLLKMPNWLLNADGELLNGVPYSALPIALAKSGSFEYLIVRHSLRLLPSADLVTLIEPQLNRTKFLGVADPIYNTADPRWNRDNHQTTLARTNLMLARLVGSKREIETSVGSLHPSSSELLFGKDATVRSFEQALSSRPDVIHFAVHVISPPDRPQEAALALSLTKTGVPDLITPEAVSSYQVPGALVVLSGCASQQGEVLPIVGVIGLSRSWLTAGAGAVVVSAWPTPDTDGKLFAKFYQYFQRNTAHTDSVSRRSAHALHLAQRDFAVGNMVDRRTTLWAAYSVISTD